MSLSTFIQTLDQFQQGENGTVEHKWAPVINYQEKITQFSFQLTRTKSLNMDHLKNILIELLSSLSFTKENEIYLSTLYKMIGQTRDIIAGKGEYQLAYMMIHTWNQFYPELASFALQSFVLSSSSSSSTSHPFGSWKDIKYFCHYFRSQSDFHESHPLYLFCLQLVNNQLKKDANHLDQIEQYREISLLAKWIPRENSKFGWMFQSLAMHFYPHYIRSAKTELSKQKAILKCKTMYRRLITSLNHILDTLQIKQCQNQWSRIQFHHVTSISLSKQKRSFLNQTKSKKVRYPDREDRIQCADHFQQFIDHSIKENIEIKGKRVSITEFVQQAIHCDNEIEKKIIDLQWKSFMKQNIHLKKFIAMVDTSASMMGDPLLAAIGLGICVAENSDFGPRVLTFDNKPEWVNLDNLTSFVDRVQHVKKCKWGGSTNFYSALQLILNAIVRAKLSPSEVQDMTLVVFSDMQINQASEDKSMLTMFENIQQRYKETGIELYGEPFQPPHILFWNLRSTNGFPTTSQEPNVTMLSGFSPMLLNVFSEQNMQTLLDITPWKMLLKTLSHERYDVLENHLRIAFV